jgi:hypothetical protein
MSTLLLFETSLTKHNSSSISASLTSPMFGCKACSTVRRIFVLRLLDAGRTLRLTSTLAAEEQFLSLASSRSSRVSGWLLQIAGTIS